MTNLPRYVPGSGNSNAKLVILGESPGKYEEIEGTPFVGPSGEMLDDILQQAGCSRSDVYITNVVKYRPPDNKLERLKEYGITIEECLPTLHEELANINPNVILAVGDTALYYTTGLRGIKKWRGSILQTHDKRYKVVPTIHTANLLPNSSSKMPFSTKHIIFLDVLRALEESKNNSYEIPRPCLTVCRSLRDAYRFLQTCLEYKIVAADIEASKGIPICIALAYDENNAMSFPFLDIQSDQNPTGIPLHEQAEIVKLIAETLPKLQIIGQNWKYDEGQLLNVWGIKSGPLHADTSLLAHTLNPEFPKSLEFNTSVYTRQPYYKDEGKQINADWQGNKKDRIYLYNARDTTTDYAIYKAQSADLAEYGLSNFYYKFVMPLHGLYSRMERRGFRVNEQKRCELLIKYLNWEAAIQKEIVELIGYPINWRSTVQVRKVLKDTLKFGNLGAGQTDEDVLIMLISNHCTTTKDFDKVRKRVLTLISLGRRVSKTIGTYLLAAPDYDGRMRTQYRIAVAEDGRAGGTETGRSSTSVLKPPVRPTQVGMAFQTLTTKGGIGDDVLEILEADPGYIIIGADLAQADARFAAAYSDDAETLRMFDEIDIHKRTASWIFKKDEDKIDKKTERHCAKTTRYLGQYDGQKNRCMKSIMADSFKFNIDIHVTEYQAGQFLQLFHNYTPKLKSIFHEGIQECLRENRTIITPYGRRRMFFDRWSEGLFRKAYAHSCSAPVIDHVRKAMLDIEAEKPDTQFCLEWHDAFYITCLEDEVDFYAPLMQEKLMRPISFKGCSLERNDLVIPSEVKVGKSVGEMEVYKR